MAEESTVAEAAFLDFLSVTGVLFSALDFFSDLPWPLGVSSTFFLLPFLDELSKTLALGVGLGVAFGVALGVAFGVALGVAFEATLGVAFKAALGVALASVLGDADFFFILALFDGVVFAGVAFLPTLDIILK